MRRARFVLICFCHSVYLGICSPGLIIQVCLHFLQEVRGMVQPITIAMTSIRLRHPSVHPGSITFNILCKLIEGI